MYRDPMHLSKVTVYKEIYVERLDMPMIPYYISLRRFEI